jgi:hypothetical protein
VSPARECRHCGDPLPLDSRCDCQGDPDRDYTTGHQELAAHEMPVRLAPRLGRRTEGSLNSIVEGLGDSVSLADVWV